MKRMFLVSLGLLTAMGLAGCQTSGGQEATDNFVAGQLRQHGITPAPSTTGLSGTNEANAPSRTSIL